MRADKAKGWKRCLSDIQGSMMPSSAPKRLNGARVETANSVEIFFIETAKEVVLVMVVVWSSWGKNESMATELTW